ncbi:MAG: VCBS repeat-containing protein, partial [Candidatus Eisenbacteria sp.]|nr:VCBS repeat-containing protein [Candidatus Eisenbacteria bacterium]
GEAMYGSPAAADVDLDGDLEVLVGSGEIYGWHHTGVEIVDGDGDPSTQGVLAPQGTGGYRSSIAVGQLDDDPYPEIVGAAWGDVGTPEDPRYEVFAWNAEDGTVLDGWPVTTSRRCWATPALGDLDHDGLDEVILPSANGYLYAWKANGTELIDGDNNPATQGIFADLRANFAYASPALADLDQDHELEILVASRCESVFCFNPDGSPVPGWPVNMGASSRSSIAVGDVNNNGQLEVVATANNNQVRLLSAAGATFPNWPVPCVLMGADFPASPTLADLDGDGDLEIIQPSVEGEIHIWTWEGDTFPGWPQWLDDGCHSCASVADVDGDPDLEIVVGCDDGKVY